MNIKRTIHRFLAGVLILAFLVSDVRVYAQGAVQLPAPGTRLALSSAFIPPLLKGIKVYRNDPFRFDFILDKGDVTKTDDELKTESNRLIKYFLASLTVPEKDLWVNLSPYEKDRIVTEAFGQTEMGRDLLAQDYILKQITASVIYPEGEVGKQFWAKVYAKAQEKYGTTDIPVDTFNKVWIIPEKATVRENKDAAFVVESKLKVMLDEDYLALEKNTDVKEASTVLTNKLGSDIVREVVIPVLEKEVNEGKNFAPLRQVYNSLILATWYKRKIKASIMGQAYVDKQKTGGIDIADKNEKEKIWAQYVEAFKQGAFDLVKEEQDPATKEILPRKYFSGGADFDLAEVFKVNDRVLLPDIPSDHAVIVQMQVEEEFSELTVDALLDLFPRKADGMFVNLMTTEYMENIFPSDYPVPGKNILVIGSGAGSLCFRLKLEGARVTGVDADEHSVILARIVSPYIDHPLIRNDLMRPEPQLNNLPLLAQAVAAGEIEKKPQQGLDFINGNVMDLHFLQEDSFDASLVPFVLGWANGLTDQKEIKKAVQEVLRVTRPGGIVYISPISAKETRDLDDLLFSLEEGPSGKRMIRIKEGVFRVVDRAGLEVDKAQDLQEKFEKIFASPILEHIKARQPDDFSFLKEVMAPSDLGRAFEAAYDWARQKSPEEIITAMDERLRREDERKKLSIHIDMPLRMIFLRPTKGHHDFTHILGHIATNLEFGKLYVSMGKRTKEDLEKDAQSFYEFLFAIDALGRTNDLLFTENDVDVNSPYFKYLADELVVDGKFSDPKIFLSFADLLIHMASGLGPSKGLVDISAQDLRAALDLPRNEHIKRSVVNYLHLVDVLKAALSDTGEGQFLGLRRLREAMDLAENVAQNGGIDLDPGKLDLKVNNADGEINFDLDPVMLRRLQNASGVIPVIVGVHAFESVAKFMDILH